MFLVFLDAWSRYDPPPSERGGVNLTDADTHRLFHVAGPAGVGGVHVRLNRAIPVLSKVASWVSLPPRSRTGGLKQCVSTIVPTGDIGTF